MSEKGGGRFESFDWRRSSEDPFGRGSGLRGDRAVEDSAERENYWLAGIGVTPETLERIREYPANAENSTEYLLYTLLYSKLIEEGGDWDPSKKTRVRNLLGILRVVGYPNMTEEDQTMLVESASGGHMVASRYEITPDAVSDVRWIWGTFGLQRPTEGMGVEILGQPSSTPQILPPQN